jgi:spore coat protein CotF
VNHVQSDRLNDKQILNDMLMTEKYIGDTYETAIMETVNLQVREALQHIQREEQEHAKQIFDSMQPRGWDRTEPANNPQ